MEKIDKYGNDKKENIYLNCTILAWTLLYIIIRKIFNVFLKERNVSLLQRERIINSLWSWIFHLIGLYYLKFYYLTDVPSKLPKKSTLNLIYFWMKGFCLNFVGVKIFICNAWISGFNYLFFTLFVFSDSHNCFSPHILYVFTIKVVDILVLEASRFLFILWKDNCGNVFSKFLFVIHSLYWTYMYLYFTPNFLLSPQKELDSSRIFYFYLWYTMECFDSVWIKLFKYNRNEPWLKSYLFSSSKESELLMNIYKKYKDRSKNVHGLKRKLDFRKTVKCAIAVKKTMNRLRKAQREHAERLKTIDSQTLKVHEEILEPDNSKPLDEQLSGEKNL